MKRTSEFERAARLGRCIRDLKGKERLSYQDIADISSRIQPSISKGMVAALGVGRNSRGKHTLPSPNVLRTIAVALASRENELTDKYDTDEVKAERYYLAMMQAVGYIDADAEPVIREQSDSNGHVAEEAIQEVAEAIASGLRRAILAR